MGDQLEGQGRFGLKCLSSSLTTSHLFLSQFLLYYLLFFSNIFFQGMTLPNFLLEEEEQERADLTRKEKIYTQSMRSQDC